MENLSAEQCLHPVRYRLCLCVQTAGCQNAITTARNSSTPFSLDEGVGSIFFCSAIRLNWKKIYGWTASFRLWKSFPHTDGPRASHFYSLCGSSFLIEDRDVELLPMIRGRKHAFTQTDKRHHGRWRSHQHADNSSTGRGTGSREKAQILKRRHFTQR